MVHIVSRRDTLFRKAFELSKLAGFRVLCLIEQGEGMWSFESKPDLWFDLDHFDIPLLTAMVSPQTRNCTGFTCRSAALASSKTTEAIYTAGVPGNITSKGCVYGAESRARLMEWTTMGSPFEPGASSKLASPTSFNQRRNRIGQRAVGRRFKRRWA